MRQLPVDETYLKKKFMEVARERLRGFVCQRLEIPTISGWPDIVIAGMNYTSWHEFKFADPDFDSTGIQELTMNRLARASYARYVIYIEEPKGIRIVHPKDFAQWATSGVYREGWDHEWVAFSIYQAHAAQNKDQNHA
jgi:hypothetical protein